MYKILTKSQRQELINELKIERSRRYADRIRVILLLDEEKRYVDICKYLFLDEGTIANYKKRYREGGLEGLILDKYCTRRIKLTETQEKMLAKELEENIFSSTKSVINYIQKKFKVSFSVSGCNSLLHRLGFSFKKAKGVPGKAKKEEQELFIEKYNALNPNVRVYFGDATHPIHNTILASGWIKKGTEKEILTSSGRYRVNIFGAISIGGKEIITRSYQTINQKSVCNFLKAIREKNKNNKKIILILDQGPSNKARSVRELAEKLNIELMFLPPYSPNLNPIERLWKFFKKKVLYNKYYEKHQEFKLACSTFFRGIRQYRSELKSLLTDNFTPVGT